MVHYLFKYCIMAAIDIKDPYCNVPTHLCSRKFLKVAVQSDRKILHLQYQALPFVVSQASGIISEIMVYIRKKDTVPYLDDFPLLPQSETTLKYFGLFSPYTKEDSGRETNSPHNLMFFSRNSVGFSKL